MNTRSRDFGNSHIFGSREILATAWITAALLILFPATRILDGSFPIFSLTWLVVPLVALLRCRDSSQLGVRPIGWIKFFQNTCLNLAGSLALMMCFEPWSHTYQVLYTEAISGAHLDTTFGWLARFPGLTGWIGFMLFSSLVTLFAEELFFRGWLLHWLQIRMSSGKAVLVQATLFAIPQLLAATLLPPMQGILYALFYAWLAIGLIGGWVAYRTQSIWPSLTSATICNLIMVIFITRSI